jgi:hypothetical protein
MSKKLIRPPDIEEAQINATALTDPDNLPLTDIELQQFRAQATAGKLASMMH